MNIRRIAAIALSNRDFESFEEKLEEACRWVSLAAEMGADLAVLPEGINLWRGDGPGNPRALTIAEVALADWQAACRPLFRCAVKHKVALTIPIYQREGSGFLNCFHLISKEGGILGRYAKERPTDGELHAGVIAATDNQPIDWCGIKVGGAICFDINFPEVFSHQRADGVQLFLCPSLFPGGDQMNYFASTLQCPIVLAYPAWSRIIDLLGHEVAGGGYRHETLRFGFGAPVYVTDVNFDKAVFHFGGNQEKIEALLRRYGDRVKLEFDQADVRFTLESVADDLPLRQVVDEMKLTPYPPQLVYTRPLTAKP